MPASSAANHRAKQGRLFETEVVEKLRAQHPATVVIGDGEGTEREDATLAAMKEGASVIISGRLPTDLAGRRVGEPDLLVRAADEVRYRPVDRLRRSVVSAALHPMPTR